MGQNLNNPPWIEITQAANRMDPQRVNDTEQPIWVPTEEWVKATNLFAFMQRINEKYDHDFSTYAELYAWSIANLTDFWAAVWESVGIQASQPFEVVVDDEHKLPGANWFAGARLNFAENLLRYHDEQPAILFRGEGMASSRVLTYAELQAEVTLVADALRGRGVVPGDRVVGFMPNLPETIVAMLAAASLGALWSSCSPDFGVKGVLDRFAQLQPKILFTADGYFYNGKAFDSLEKIAEILAALPTPPAVVVVPYSCKHADIAGLPNAIHYEDFKAGADPLAALCFAQLPFDHPLYIMFSSGTTGLPKCIVQSAGGILLNQLKEQVLQVDLKRSDRIFYFTTCGWMMWNWLVSALGVGATVVLFDGSPFHPEPATLWKFAAEEKITIFGTSAKYLTALEKAGVEPKQQFDLSNLRVILSTGSPLSEESYDFVYQKIGGNLLLASISGGTDLNGCFAGGNPIGAVYRGELQCRQLGMAVQAFDEHGQPVIGEKGELVCTAAFPSMPLYFWDDADGQKYQEAYFDVYPNVWRHGDFIEINERGGVKIFGRSDATLNPGGVRIGTAEIYRQMETLNEILDSLVIGQDWEEGDVRIILFAKMRPGVELDEALKKRIVKLIRTNCSPRHVPARIIAVADIPYTISGKKVELAVRKVVHHENVTNRDALANPEALQYYENLAELQS